MNKKSFQYIIVGFIFICLSSSCKKYLDQKSDTRLSTPSTLNDLQAILDNSMINFTAGMLNTAADEFYIGYTELINTDPRNAQTYVWDPQAMSKTDLHDWKEIYTRIFNANTVLDNLEKIPSAKNQEDWNAIRGAALFFRGFNFFQAVQLYAPQYDAVTAGSDPGIPLRLNSNFNTASKRATIQETYNQVISDLQEAATLMKNDAGFKTRPSRPAAHALLARVYIQAGQYEKALEQATKCLDIYSSIMDYNEIPDAFAPFQRFNKEVIFYALDWTSITCFYDYRAIADTLLYDSYHENDLRKKLFFEDIYGDNNFRFTGNYNGSSEIDGMFTGLATDEVYLIRAECYARTNKVTEALADLNTLMEKRWVQGTFLPFDATNTDDALKIILTERKKELVYRATRWSDLRRLNKDERFAVTLTRKLNGETYTLPPNDLRYTFLIPADVIIRSGIQQNAR